MARAVGNADISILPPGYSEDVGLHLLTNEDGSVAFRKTTRSILPSAAPPNAPGSESFDPQVRLEYVIESAHRGVGYDHHTEGAERAGLVKSVNTLVQDQLFCGPKIHYIGDIDYLDNGNMESFQGSGVPTGWTNVSAATIAEENTIVAEGTSSVKVTSAGAGDLCRFTLAHANFIQCKLTLTGKVYVPAGDSAAIVRIANSIGNVDHTTTSTNTWESVDISLTLATTSLSALTIDLIPATGDIAYFDDLKLRIDYLVGPSGPFTELEISGVDTLFHFSGRTTWKLDTADRDPAGLPRWKATELASHTIEDAITMNDRMWRLEGTSGLWTHSTDGSTWSDNGRSGNDRYGTKLEVTQTIFGYDALWKATPPNLLGVSTTPSTGGWMYYKIGNEDSDILDLVVESNILYIVKEDGVYIIGSDGIPRNITSSWKKTRQVARSSGGNGWLGDVYIPTGSHSLWRMNPSSRKPAHPGQNSPGFDEYNGPVTYAIGDDSWLYAFLQKRNTASPTLMNIMAGRPTDNINWRWGQVAEIDAGVVNQAWITGTQMAGTKLFWASQDQEADRQSIADDQSPSAATNTDNSSKREWSNPTNARAGDDNYATWPDESDAQQERSAGTVAVTNYTSGEPWDNASNIGSSDNSKTTSDMDAVGVGEEISGTVVNQSIGSTTWGSTSNAQANNTSYANVQTAEYPMASNYLMSDNYGFDIPSDATIVGIEAKIGDIYRDSTGTAYVGTVRLHNNGTEFTGVSAKTGSGIGTSVGTQTFGGSSDTWGKSDWTAADVEHADFGFKFVVHKSADDSSRPTVYVDYVAMNIYYTLPDTDGLRATNFSFSGVLPADAEIKGIEVDVEKSVDAGSDVTDKLVQLVVGGSLVGNNKADTGTAWGTSDATANYGGATDLWGLTPSRSQVVASDFGVEIRATKGTSTSTRQARIDHVTITIHYDTNETSDYLDVQNFGFDIPTGATINGIIVSVERKSNTGTVKDASLRLLNASGVAAGDDKAKLLDAWPTSDASVSYGSPSDTWSISPTVAMVNDADFGVRLSVSGDVKDDVASVDHISMKVYYTADAGSEFNNRLGWVAVPNTENPRYDPEYEFETGGTFRTGRITRFPGWKTAWQEVTIKTSPETGEKLGSNGRQVTVKYNTFDGTGFNELGGSGNGVFNTSPAQTKFFKTGDVSSVVSEDIELELSLAHDEDLETPVITQVSLAGTVRPRIVDVFEFSVLVADDTGFETTRGEDKRLALRAMLDPDQWASTLYDREGVAHVVIPYVNGYSETDALHYPDPTTGESQISRVVTMQCFVVPNSTSWSS
tara:strand:- start:1370 stop:5290 length:3921 start_codon:yes stop_codon:yes gene_type:complete